MANESVAADPYDLDAIRAVPSPHIETQKILLVSVKEKPGKHQFSGLILIRRIRPSGTPSPIRWKPLIARSTGCIRTYGECLKNTSPA
jgi:hypothetical protein